MFTSILYNLQYVDKILHNLPPPPNAIIMKPSEVFLYNLRNSHTILTLTHTDKHTHVHSTTHSVAHIDTIYNYITLTNRHIS